MADLNSLTVVGRLTKDAEMKKVGEKGTTLVCFSLANNTGYGQFAKTNFFAVNLWGAQGERLMPYLTKGKQVGVTGVLENQKWTDNEGNQRDSWAIKVTGDIWLGATPQGQKDMPIF